MTYTKPLHCVPYLYPRSLVAVLSTVHTPMLTYLFAPAIPHSLPTVLNRNQSRAYDGSANSSTPASALTLAPTLIQGIPATKGSERLRRAASVPPLAHSQPGTSILGSEQMKPLVAICSDLRPAMPSFSMVSRCTLGRSLINPVPVWCTLGRSLILTQI